MYHKTCIAWSTDNNNLDLSGLLVPFDVGVFRTDQASGETMLLPNTRVEITSSYSGVYLIPQQAVEVVSYPDLPGGITSQEDVKAACTDANGNYAMNEDWCAWYWDTESSTFYQFAGTYADAYMNMTPQMDIIGMHPHTWWQKQTIEVWYELTC